MNNQTPEPDQTNRYIVRLIRAGEQRDVRSEGVNASEAIDSALRLHDGWKVRGYWISSLGVTPA